MNRNMRHKADYKIMLGLVILSLMGTSVAWVAAAPKPGMANRLVRVPMSLNVYFDGQYRTIKHAYTFFGYGWLDNHHVFVATQRHDRIAAPAALEVINLRTWKAARLKGLGNATYARGEANFAVNRTSGEIVVGGHSNLQFMKLDLKTSTYRLATIKSGPCWSAFWINARTVGCLHLGQQETLMRFTVPPYPR